MEPLVLDELRRQPLIFQRPRPNGDINRKIKFENEKFNKKFNKKFKNTNNNKCNIL